MKVAQWDIQNKIKRKLKAKKYRLHISFHLMERKRELGWTKANPDRFGNKYTLIRTDHGCILKYESEWSYAHTIKRNTEICRFLYTD